LLPKNFDPYKEVALEALKGLGKLPDLLLTLAAKFPYFGDVCKAQMLGWEFKWLDQTPESYCFGGCHGLMCAGVEKGTKEENEVWFAGLVGRDDFE
jgi:hypothetical protein